MADHAAAGLPAGWYLIGADPGASGVDPRPPLDVLIAKVRSEAAR